jgi:type III pantothenate kinase
MSAQTYLLLDCGNSRIKWRLQSGASILDQGTLEQAALASARTDGLAALAGNSAGVLVASVAGDAVNARLRTALDAAGVSAWFATSRATLDGLVNSYREPERLGVDRWLAMLALWAETRDRFAIVDAGSALTIDLVTADGRHAGGYILPGLSLMQRSLQADTEQVRFDEQLSPALTPGTSTAEAVVHGAALALVGAVEQVIDPSGLRPEQIFLCGGDAPTLAPLLSRPPQRRDELVLDGLWRQAMLQGEVPGEGPGQVQGKK